MKSGGRRGLNVRITTYIHTYRYDAYKWRLAARWCRRLLTKRPRLSLERLASQRRDLPCESWITSCGSTGGSSGSAGLGWGMRSPYFLSDSYSNPTPGLGNLGHELRPRTYLYSVSWPKIRLPIPSLCLTVWHTDCIHVAVHSYH